MQPATAKICKMFCKTLGLLKTQEELITVFPCTEQTNKKEKSYQASMVLPNKDLLMDKISEIYKTLINTKSVMLQATTVILCK